MIRAIFLVSSLAVVTLLGTFSDVSAQSYSSYYGSQIMCPMDAYVCTDGTTVGRTGPNCQFVCPITQTPAPASYYYTSGCYTYYYNGYTRTTTITNYNCQSNYTITYPSSQYYTYNYCNGSWKASYYGYNNCNNIFNWGSGYAGYNGYYGTYNNYSYNNYSNYVPTCYTYAGGYQVCQ